jgi:hypothetical protein
MLIRVMEGNLMIHAFARKNIINGSICAVVGESNGLIEIEPVSKENNSGQLVRVVEGLMDLMDGRNFHDYNDGKYIIKAGEFCKVERIENVNENEDEKVG